MGNSRKILSAATSWGGRLLISNVCTRAICLRRKERRGLPVLRVAQIYGRNSRKKWKRIDGTASQPAAGIKSGREKSRSEAGGPEMMYVRGWPHGPSSLSLAVRAYIYTSARRVDISRSSEDARAPRDTICTLHREQTLIYISRVSRAGEAQSRRGKPLSSPSALARLCIQQRRLRPFYGTPFLTTHISAPPILALYP